MRIYYILIIFFIIRFVNEERGHYTMENIPQ